VILVTKRSTLRYKEVMERELLGEGEQNNVVSAGEVERCFSLNPEGLL
jgi:hypothetical protein